MGWFVGLVGLVARVGWSVGLVGLVGLVESVGLFLFGMISDLKERT